MNDVLVAELGAGRCPYPRSSYWFDNTEEEPWEIYHIPAETLDQGCPPCELASYTAAQNNADRGRGVEATEEKEAAAKL